MRKATSRILRRVVVALVVVTLAVALTAYLKSPDYRNSIAEQRAKCGTIVVDRKDRPLRLLPDSRERMNLWCGIDRVPQILKLAVIAAEDHRFYYHPGFDPLAISRALYKNLLSGRTVSGASTITQQVVRLIHPRPRTYGSKMIELLASLKMEWQLSKEQILELYVNLSPMGGNMRGVSIASRTYFGKDVRSINAAEAAVLAALPRSPSRYDPRNPKGRRLLLIEKDRVLKRMVKLGWLSPDKLTMMLGRSVEFQSKAAPPEAPHFVDLVLSRVSEKTHLIKTTVDLDIQQSLERILHSHKGRLARMGIQQAGATVASTTGPEVLGMVGSLGYGERDLGYNNAVLAQRGAGSTLKPFLYALALEKGYNAFSEIPDTFRSYTTPRGDYLPLNADRRWYGPVTVRLALGNSLNIPAVKIANSVGINDFYKFLKRLDIVDEHHLSAEHYGLGLAIGNLEVTLYGLVQAYCTLAREGLYRPLSLMPGEKLPEKRLLSSETTYVIKHILADPSARLLTFGNPSCFDFGFPVCVKTGTSSNYRDCWIIAYTSRHVIGLWAGNFSGRPTGGGSGAAVLGPILEEIIHYLYAAGEPGDFVRPGGVKEVLVCWMSGKPASPNCPHAARELVVHESGEAEPCDLLHRPDHYYYLDAAYADWLHRREIEQGRDRFRLMTLRPKSLGVHWIGTSGVDRVSGSVTKAARIEIVSPHNFDRFILSPHNSNRVRFRAVPDPVVDHVVWVLDGSELVRTPPPYEFLWEPTRGSHVIHAVTPTNVAAQVTIHVE